MREVYFDQLRIADACAYFGTTALSKVTHISASIEMFAARTFHKSEAIRSYYRTLALHKLSSKKCTQKVYEDGVLKVGMAWFSRYVLQVEMA